MSGIILKIDKGDSEAFHEIMGLLWNFPYIKECKNHLTIRLSEEDMVMHAQALDRIIGLLPIMKEENFFKIPIYGTDEWANWMIDLHQKKSRKSVKK